MPEMTKAASTAVVQYVPAPIAVGAARGLPTAPEIDVMRVIASTVVVAAGMVPDWIKTEEQALAVMIAGHEMGLTPMTALRHVYIVNGRTDFDAQILMGLVKAGDPSADFEFERYDAEGCIVVLHRNGHRPLRVSYTKVDAEASGQLKPKQRKKYGSDAFEWDPVAKKSKIKQGARSIGWEDIPGPWQLYPRDMYAWAAIKRAGRLGASELINGIPSRTVRELVDAPAKWIDAPDPTKALNPGDDGKVNPLIEAVVAAPPMADPDTGEIMGEEGDEEAQDGDYEMAGAEAADTTEAGPGEAQAAAAPPYEDPEPERPQASTLLAATRALFNDFVGSQETAVVQSLVIQLWRRWPETRGEDKNLHLELVADDHAIALRDYLEAAQRAGGIPKEG